LGGIVVHFPSLKGESAFLFIKIWRRNYVLE
jgi:hypothetical protein